MTARPAAFSNGASKLPTKAASCPPRWLASESSDGFQNPLPRRRANGPGGDSRLVKGETPRNHPAVCDGLFDHIDFLQSFPYVGASVRGHPNVRRLLHSPLYVYYRVDAGRAALRFFISGTSHAEPRSYSRGAPRHAGPSKWLPLNFADKARTRRMTRSANPRFSTAVSKGIPLVLCFAARRRRFISALPN